MTLTTCRGCVPPAIIKNQVVRHIKRRKYTDKEVRYVAEHIVDAEIERVTKIEQEQAEKQQQKLL